MCLRFIMLRLFYYELPLKFALFGQELPDGLHQSDLYCDKIIKGLVVIVPEFIIQLIRTSLTDCCSIIHEKVSILKVNKHHEQLQLRTNLHSLFQKQSVTLAKKKIDHSLEMVRNTPRTFRLDTRLQYY